MVPPKGRGPAARGRSTSVPSSPPPELEEEGHLPSIPSSSQLSRSPMAPQNGNRASEGPSAVNTEIEILRELVRIQQKQLELQNKPTAHTPQFIPSKPKVQL